MQIFYINVFLKNIEMARVVEHKKIGQTILILLLSGVYQS